MPSPRKIRETAVQFLYCSDLEGGADPADLLDPFWDCITESDRRRLLTAVFRSIHHLAQGREQRLTEWTGRMEAAVADLSLHEETVEHAAILGKLQRSELKWNELLAGLQRLSLDGEDEVILPRLEAALDQFFSHERELAALRSSFLELAAAADRSARDLEALIASTGRLQRISERLAMLEHPEDFPEQADLAKLRESKTEMEQLRSGTERIVDRIRQSRALIDRTLAAVVENFSPERIDPIDRAILRLATAEILDGETPPKVAINEAVELAKRFGTTDSSRFVNGVLDRVACELRGKQPEH